MTRTPPFWLAPLARIAALLLTLLGRTWRIEHPDDYVATDARLLAGEPCIYALWHARLLPLVLSHRHRGVGVLISRHRDGEWIARVVEALGYRTARGSSTRGGEAGLREMMQLVAEGHSLAITPDGPRGPAERVKPGLIYLASRSGWPILPVAFGTDRAWTFGSWDRFRIPKPFARVHIAYGEPLHVPRDLDASSEEEWRLRAEQAIDHVTRTSAAVAGETA